jgi:hypothetical protein
MGNLPALQRRMEMTLTMGLIGGWNLLQGESHICKLVQGGSVVPTEAASRQDCSECVQNVERGSAIQALKNTSNQVILKS